MLLLLLMTALQTNGQTLDLPLNAKNLQTFSVGRWTVLMLMLMMSNYGAKPD